MEILSKLFGSETKVKMIRLFLFNPNHAYDTGNISERIQSKLAQVRREIGYLKKMGLIKQKQITRPLHKKRTVKGYTLDVQFPYLLPLQNFLISIEPLQPKEIARKISRLGSIKLVLVAGVFIQDPESRIDLLIVGDGVRTHRLDTTIRNIEAEMGKELKYAYFTTEDFKYRLSMYDKLTRDILDYPHKKVLNKLGVL